MELTSAATDLRDLLVSQDIARHQVSILDGYISDLGQRSFASELQGNSVQNLRLMLRVSVTEGVRQVYDQYFQRKQQEVQKTARKIIQSISDDDSTDEHQPIIQLPTRNRVRSSGGHRGTNLGSDKAAGKWTSVDCHFYRGS